ncbi:MULTISPECIES: mycothiol synthase [Kocuria]|uniref:Mycothiol acetyltransferase n=1 Tax=Kocuria subflava TaxID=1736139 RepID=A0A846TYZ1_9MICC|nr:mycothiol synthase [Kocuria sp. CPCC 104605]NKE09495.1 mycothiol synthase [Kocuria subflava]
MNTNPSPSVAREDLRPLTVQAVVALGNQAADHDGDPPFSDQTLVQLRSAPETVTLIGARSAAPGCDDALVGAAVVIHGNAGAGAADETGPTDESADHRGQPAVLEAVVAPEHRGTGVGRALIEAALSTSAVKDTAVDAWAHGDHAAARSLADSLGFTPVRELHRLLMPLDGVREALDATLPEGLALRAFEVGRDEEAWLSVNAAAFAHHPEQGRMTLEDLRARESEDWFDPQGFLLAHPVDDPDTIAGFHWTKVHPATSTEPARGEVHVVGTAPDQQGRGLGKALTAAGLHHLADQGLDEVLLYVDAENTVAFNLYRALGFQPWHVDVMFSRS